MGRNYVTVTLCVFSSCDNEGTSCSRVLLLTIRADSRSTNVTGQQAVLCDCTTEFRVRSRGVTQPSGAPRHFLRSGALPSDLK